MFDLNEPLARYFLVFVKSVTTRVVSGCPICCHPCDSHVRYDLSHSTSPLASLQAFRVGMMLNSFGFCAPFGP